MAVTPTTSIRDKESEGEDWGGIGGKGTKREDWQWRGEVKKLIEREEEECML